MKKVPREIVRLVKTHQVLLSSKARYQLDAGYFDTDDLIHSIIHGKVVKKERDERRQSQYKYTIIGPCRSGDLVYSCGKVVRLLKKSYFVITFHEAR